jgi:hypothetical protein
MIKSWKALGGVVVALALIAAPLSASAEEAPPPDAVVEEITPAEEVAPEVVPEPVVEEPVAPPVVEPEPVVTEEAVAPTAVVNEPYVLVLWAADDDGGDPSWPQSLVTFTTTSSTSLDSLDAWADKDCTFYQVDLYANDATTAALIAGGHLNAPNSPEESFADIYGPKWKQWTTTCPPPPVDDIPPTITIVPDCDNEAGNILVTVWSDNDVNVPVTLYLDFNGDGTPDASEVLQVVPGETILHYTFTEDLSVGIGVQFGEAVIFQEVVTADCEPNTQVYPVPAFFNADVPAPTCATAAEFVTPGELIAGGEVIYEDDEIDLIVYRFENVDVAIWRDIPGEVYIEIYAHDGYVLEGLSPDWNVAEDGSWADRTIVLAGAIGYQNDDPEQPCFFAIVPQPAAPIFIDLCGAEDDGFDVPADTDEYAYETVHEGATVTVNAVLLDPINEWSEGVTTSWSFTFTDADCPTTTTTPPPTPAKPASLAATGGSDLASWGVGAGALMMAGLALIALRRVVRQ